MLKKNYKEVESKQATLHDGTEIKDVSVRWLIDKNDGAKYYAMRRFEVKPGAEIPLHDHPEDHEIFILKGNAKFYNDTGQEEIVNEGDVLYIPPNEKHGIANLEKKSLIFICCIPYF
ncbi:MAG: cupin domain-containing protein [Promethearchaeota archaeon]